MTTEIYLPRLGSTTMEAATVLEWFVVEGDRVDKDQPLVEVETDKTNVEIPSPGAGVILRIDAPVGTEVLVGATIGWIGEPGEAIPETSADAPGSAPSTTRAPSTEPASNPSSTGSPGVPPGAGMPKASPAARRRARELGVDLALVTGTGPGGRISGSDIENAAAKDRAEPASADDGVAEGEPLAPVRRRIAQRMARASDETAPVTLTRQVDASALVAARRDDRTAGDGGPGVLDRIVAACARVLRGHPDLNATFVDDRVHRSTVVSVGIAVQTEAGLIVPVIVDVDPDDLADVADRRRALTRRALEGSLSPDDVSGGTFTVTNLGGHGIDAFTPIINIPQVAVLGVGRIHDAVLAVEGSVVVRPAMMLSLTFDHRVVDGAPAAVFLSELAELLEPQA